MYIPGRKRVRTTNIINNTYFLYYNIGTIQSDIILYGCRSEICAFFLNEKMFQIIYKSDTVLGLFLLYGFSYIYVHGCWEQISALFYFRRKKRNFRNFYVVPIITFKFSYVTLAPYIQVPLKQIVFKLRKR